NSVFAFLRQPIVLLASVSTAIGLFWWFIGLPVQMPRSPLAQYEKLYCVSYEPYRGSQSPLDENLVIPPAQIEEDVALLAPYTSCLRTYMTGMGLDKVPEIAKKYGLQVLMGIAIGRDAKKNEQEIARAVLAAKAQRDSIRALVVGSEVLS